MKKPTHKQIKLLETILLLEAYIETIRPRIEAIYNDVLFYMIPEHIAVDRRTGEKVTDHKMLYRLEDSKYVSAYYQEARKVMIEKGFKPEKDNCCFLLEREATKRDLEREFAKACCETLPEMVLKGQTPDQFFEAMFKHYKIYKDFVDLCKRYVIGFVDTKKLKAAIEP